MIRPEMAKKFIDQITEYTEYNINIMDESGVIIASRDEKRIGTYHEAADRIIRGKEEIVVIEDDKIYPGVLPGINMAIMVNGRKEGVVGVTGDPGRIHEVAMVTRLAIEAMLKYEKQQGRRNPPIGNQGCRPHVGVRRVHPPHTDFVQDS